MGNIAFRKLYRDMLLRQINRPGQLPLGSSIVFAPHQDDETLGCGGTIIQKRRAGVPVWIVFMTDGGRSHKNFMSIEEMKSLRMLEACKAGKLLGVAEEQIRFMQFSNGELNQRRVEAQKEVELLLSEIRPREVFIPSPWDFHFEHRETALIVMAAVAQLHAKRVFDTPPQVYEYPIWFWYQWPLVGLPSENAEERSRLLKRGLRYGFGLTFLTQFRCTVPIRDVLDVKREALAQYASQMTRLTPDANWATLQDVANGEFLQFFFQNCEIFRLVKAARSTKE